MIACSIACLSLQVASAEAKGRRELQETRSLVAAMEDKAASLQEQVSARSGIRAERRTTAVANVAISSRRS